MKVAFHTSRHQRTKINIHDARYAELEAHIDRFDGHKIVRIKLFNYSTADERLIGNKRTRTRDVCCNCSIGKETTKHIGKSI